MDSGRPLPVPQKGQMLLRVLACSLAPGDVRTLSGRTKLAQMPKSGFPYIPGGDVVGIVETPDPTCPDRFRKGDCVISRFFDTPSGGLAEYCAVKTSLTVLKPSFVPIPEAAAIPASVVVAVRLVEKWVRPGDRVLVLGATGGVGIHVVQLLKRVGASFVAATTQSVNRIDDMEEFHRARDQKAGPLVDRVIDYTSAPAWWDLTEFQGRNKFDLLFDFAAFPGAWKHCTAVLKSSSRGGRFITTTGDHASFDVLGMSDVCGLMWKMLARSCWTSMCCVQASLPYYEWYVGGLKDPIPTETWGSVFRAIEEGSLRIVVDPAGPFPFTQEGVREAFKLQESRHAYGKVVVLMG